MVYSGQVHIMAADYDHYYDKPRKVKHVPNTATLDVS